MKVIALLCCFLVKAIAVPTTKDRVINPDLSSEEHFKEGHEHNKDYDHEAILGKDESKVFDDLSPEESKARLGKLFDKMDKDGNKLVTQDEMKAWIKYTQDKYIRDDAESQFKNVDLNEDLKIEWIEYKNHTYGQPDDEETDSFKDMTRRDENRFKKADKNGDSFLNAEEYTSFLHPENDESMRSVVIEETMTDIDKDKDGKISLDEYIGDLWPQEDREANKEEPDWVKTERDQFTEHRDTNKDGFMDADETAAWILPTDFDHVTSEADHLVQESDVDKDGNISKDEMLEKYDLFVGSQATDFGEALKNHEEL